jgi:hypothetical protein
LGIPGSAIDDIVDVLCEKDQHHVIHFRLRPELSDPGDEFVLELALAVVHDGPPQPCGTRNDGPSMCTVWQ